MRIRNIIYLSLPLLLAACSDDVESPAANDGEALEIRLTATVGAQSREAFHLDTQFPEGTVLNIIVTDSSDDTELYNTTVTTGADGSLTPATPLYFPINGHAVDIRCTSNRISPVPDQQQQSYIYEQQGRSDLYLQSDLRYAVATNVKPTTSAVNLDFKHLLSKVEVQLTEAGGAEGWLADELEQLRLGNSYRNYYITLDADAASATVTGRGSDYWTTLAHDVAPDINECIVLPGTHPAGQTLFLFNFTDGTELSWAPSEAVIFEPGKKYRYIFTVTKTSLECTVTVSDWTTDDTNSDILEPQALQKAEPNADGTYTIAANTLRYIEGTLEGAVTVEDGAYLELRNVTASLTNLNVITVSGDATVHLTGNNSLQTDRGTGSPYLDACAIFVEEGCTVTIEGDGSLYAKAGTYSSAAIGGCTRLNSGNIIINGGNITAVSGAYSSSIGSGSYGHGGDITINGGTISATPTGEYGAAIGSGYYGSIGNITINGGTVYAKAGGNAAGIGAGYGHTGQYSYCGNILITGGTIEAYGGSNGAGIGTGMNSTCGTITFIGGVTTASSVGKGRGGTCGTISYSGGAVVNGTTYN